MTGGARILTETGGYYMQPTVMTRVKPQDTLAQQEVFGPVLHVVRYRASELDRVIEQIIRTDRFLIEDIQLVWRALETFKEAKADFADCLLGQRNLQAGCEYTATLDDAASQSPGYQHLLTKPKR